jgi:alpha-ketoglutarate-dependent taurine dioxygenase
LAHRLGVLSGKPDDCRLHIHPLTKHNLDKDPELNVITTDKAANPAEDLWKNRPADIRNAWHTDTGYEPNPADYSILKLVKLPETGGGRQTCRKLSCPIPSDTDRCYIDTIWSSACEIYDKISPAYRSFLEGLTATFAQARLPISAAAKGFELYAEPRGSPNNVGTSLRAVHPVVRTNPVTGWKSLFAVGNHVERINELTPDESRRLHDWFLQMIVEEHDTQLRHRWENQYDIG